MGLVLAPAHAFELYILSVNGRDLLGARHGLHGLPKVTQPAAAWPHTGLGRRGGLAG